MSKPKMLLQNGTQKIQRAGFSSQVWGFYNHFPASGTGTIIELLIPHRKIYGSNTRTVSPSAVNKYITS